MGDAPPMTPALWLFLGYAAGALTMLAGFAIGRAAAESDRARVEELIRETGRPVNPRVN